MEEPQQVQADEEYERVWERVAAIDVAKASGVACTRVPDEDRPGRRKTHVWTVTATVPAITELADHLRCHQIQVVTLESTSDYWRICLPLGCCSIGRQAWRALVSHARWVGQHTSVAERRAGKLACPLPRGAGCSNAPGLSGR